MAKLEPASIRYKNPGAMWGRVGKRPSSSKVVPTNAPIPLKWGSTQTVYLSDGMGQGNNIAVFDTWVAGICAQLDLWRSSPKYKNKRFADAIYTWSGGNNVPSYIAYCKKRVDGLTENTIMNDAFWSSPAGIQFLKAQSGHEAGKPIPAPDADWVQAQRLVFAGTPPVKSAVTKEDAGKAAVVAAVSATAATGTHQGWGLSAWLIMAGVVIALGCAAALGVWLWRRHKAAEPSYHDKAIAAATVTADALPAPAEVWSAPDVQATKPTVRKARKPAAKKATKKATKKKAA